MRHINPKTVKALSLCVEGKRTTRPNLKNVYISERATIATDGVYARVSPQPEEPSPDRPLKEKQIKNVFETGLQDSVLICLADADRLIRLLKSFGADGREHRERPIAVCLYSNPEAPMERRPLILWDPMENEVGIILGMVQKWVAPPKTGNELWEKRISPMFSPEEKPEREREDGG